MRGFPILRFIYSTAVGRGARFWIVSWALFCAEPSLATKLNCDGKIGETIGDLRKLRSDNEEVKRLCKLNESEKINTDTAFGRFPGGDCEQTYGVINALANRVEKNLSQACAAFSEGYICTGSSQLQCFVNNSQSAHKAGTKLREATLLLSKAQKILKKRVDHNESDLNQYANLGGFDPVAVMGNPPSTITGDNLRYFNLAREQAFAMQRGEQFLSKAGPIENKLNGYQAQLNSMGATSAQRAQNLTQAGSTITGPAEKLAQTAQAAQVGAAAGEMFSQQAGGAGAGGQAGSRTYKPADFVLKPDEIELSEEHFYDALGDKPMPIDLAAKIPDAEPGKKAGAGALAAKDQAPGAGTPDERTDSYAGSASQLNNGSAKLAPGDYSGSARALASMPAMAGGAGVSLTSASSPGFNGKAKPGAAKEGNEALANFEKTSGSPKLMDRGGPSLRDMLKQRLNEGGATTRAMHDVLAGIKNLPGDPVQDTQPSSQEAAPETQGAADDIKGIESESLFVRVRAAHLRFQKVHVTDL